MNVANRRLLLNALALFFLACAPNIALGHYRTRSYRYGYPRRQHSCHGGDWNGHWRYGSCGRHRSYNNLVVDLFGELVDASRNSLARQQRKQRRNEQLYRRLPARETRIKRSPSYHIQTLDNKGVELTLEIPGIKAHEMDLDITQNENGVHILTVRGTPGVHRRRMGENPEFLQSFWIKDDAFEVDGIDATVSSSGILTVSIPRKERQRTKRKRTRIVPSLLEPNRREDTMKEEAWRPLNTEDLFQQNKMKQQDTDNTEDDGLWISEAEDIL